MKRRSVLQYGSYLEKGPQGGLAKFPPNFNIVEP